MFSIETKPNTATLTGETTDARKYQIVFSYGRPAVLKMSTTVKGQFYYVVNSEVFGFSPTSRKHINAAFPEFRSSHWMEELTFLVVDDDEAFSRQASLAIQS